VLSGGRVYFVDDSWAAYEVSHLHGSDLYYVALSAALDDFDAVVSMLELARERGEDNRFISGYVAWRDDPELARDAQSLVESIKRELQRRMIQNGRDATWLGMEEQLFWQRWPRARWYWATIIFEWAFLSGLVLFALWPVIRNRSAMRRSVHVALLPLLFLLPAYLGYATYSFTSAGPSGGVVYPFLLSWVRGG
jgi:hypothetical protein